MRKILNPYDRERNMCFGCGIANPIGLRLSFTETGEYIQAEWKPGPGYQGYPDILHGGIIAALLDETAGWCVSVKVGTAGVTSEMRTKYIAPVNINNGLVTIKAEIKSQTDRTATISGQLFDGKGKLCAEATTEYFLYPPEVARRKFKYPGKESFYGKE